jgi:hypothetical protein
MPLESPNYVCQSRQSSYVQQLNFFDFNKLVKGADSVALFLFYPMDWRQEFLESMQSNA